MPARLNFDRITQSSATPQRWMYLLHGIYGSGRNWNAVSRRLVDRRPDWGVIAIDLRGHGDSETGDPPHTVHACADDLVALGRGDTPQANAVLGHSFGGKVATLFADRADSVGTLIVVDSTPSSRDPSGSAWKMLDALRSRPGPFSDRSEGIDAIEAEGYARPVAQWMGTNLRNDDDGWRWRLDVGQMEDLLRDFFDLDAWPAIADVAESGTTVELLRATESSILAADDLERVDALAKSGLPIRLTPVEGGHWLNADNPDRVVELLAELLPDQ